MRQVSKKRAQQIREYKILRDDFMSMNPFCERCNRDATENHHKNGRNGLRLLDVEYFMSVCRPCHIFVHQNPKISRENGWLI